MRSLDCLKFYVAEPCNGVGLGCMVSVVERSQVRNSRSLHMYSYKLAGQPVLSLCPDKQRLQHVPEKSNHEQSCWQQALLAACVNKGGQETLELKSECLSAIIGGTQEARP